MVMELLELVLFNVSIVCALILYDDNSVAS